MSHPFDATLKELVSQAPADFQAAFHIPAAATLGKMPLGLPLQEALREVVGEIDRRLASLPDHARAVRLMSAAQTLVTGRISKEAATRIFEGVQVMHTKTYWDEIDEALIKSTKRHLFSFGRHKFGEPDAKEEKALNRIKEHARLERMVDRIGEAASWKDLLAIR